MLDLSALRGERAKQRLYLMLGFKNFGNAAVAISGVELVREIRKGQFNITQLKVGMKIGMKIGMKVRMPQVWDAVLADR